MACFTFSARFRMGADLNTTSICGHSRGQGGTRLGWMQGTPAAECQPPPAHRSGFAACILHPSSALRPHGKVWVQCKAPARPPALTIVRECFHLVSLLRMRSRLMQENRFLQQNWLLSPASCRKGEAEARHESGDAEMKSKGCAAPKTPAPPPAALHSTQRGDTHQPKGTHRTLSDTGDRAVLRLPGMAAGALLPPHTLWKALGACREGSSIPGSPLSAPAARAPHSTGSPGRKCWREERGVTLLPHTPPCAGAMQSHAWVCLQPSHRRGGGLQREKSKHEPPPHNPAPYLFLAVM